MILIEFATEEQTTRAYALLDGQSVRTAQYNLFTNDHVKLAPHILERILASRIAPRILRLDNRGRDDINIAAIRQILLYQLQTDIVWIREVNEHGAQSETETRPSR